MNCEFKQLSIVDGMDIYEMLNEIPEERHYIWINT